MELHMYCCNSYIKKICAELFLEETPCGSIDVNNHLL